MKKKYFAVVVTAMLVLLCSAFSPMTAQAAAKDKVTEVKDKVTTAVESFFKSAADKTKKQVYDGWVEQFRKKAASLPTEVEITLNNVKFPVKLVSTVEEWKAALEESIGNYETKARLLIQNYDQKVYYSDTFMKNREALSTYTVASTTVHNIAYVEYSFTYKQGYWIAYAHENDCLGKLTESETAVYDKATAIIEAVIKPDMTDYEKELAIHDYLVNNASYDQTLSKFTPYDLLIKKKGVCEAYAQSMMLLMRMLDIPCIIVTGSSNGVSHAWNIVTIDGKDYEVDITWDDPVSDKPVLSRAYFNLTTAQMNRDHQRSSQSKDAPICKATDANYFVMSKLTANTEAELTKLILAAKEKGESEIELYSSKMTKAMAEKALKDAKIRCSYSLNGNVLRVIF